MTLGRVFLYSLLYNIDQKGQKVYRIASTQIATLFVFNLNLYVLSPLLTILGNEKMRTFVLKMVINPVCQESLTGFVLTHLNANKVGPA